MDKARQHWEILQQVPDELARKVREFMVIGWCGEGVLMATEDGEGYWMGEMWFGKESRKTMEPTRLDVPNLASMALACYHILLLTESGQIYAMGQNAQGRLGLGTDDKETHFSPQLIPSPQKFISVRCGNDHSLALTEDGKVWAWGWNDNGQVGVSRSTADFFPSPRQISELDPHRVVAVECGGHYSLALTDRGEVYYWGWIVRAQLDDGSGLFTHTPTQIFTPSPVRSMAAGSHHTLLLTQTGKVYAFGSNQYGQLGLSTTTKYSVSLVKVEGLPPISQIASHFYASFSIAMSAERECFAWGHLRNNFRIFPNKQPFTSIPLQLPPIYSTLDSVLSFGSIPCNTPFSVRVEGQNG